MAFFSINGKELPFPAVGLKLQRQQLVTSSRNARGEVVAQKVNRRIDKFDSLEWKHLTAQEWGAIQREVDKFEGVLTYWDNPSQKFVTTKVYWGDESSEIFKINPNTGEVLEYINCAVNLIDMGYNKG